MPPFLTNILQRTGLVPTPPPAPLVEEPVETKAQRDVRKRAKRNANHKENRKHPFFVKGEGIRPPDGHDADLPSDENHGDAAAAAKEDPGTTDHEAANGLFRRALGRLRSTFGFRKSTERETDAATQSDLVPEADNVGSTEDRALTESGSGSGSSGKRPAEVEEQEEGTQESTGTKWVDADMVGEGKLYENELHRAGTRSRQVEDEQIGDEDVGTEEASAEYVDAAEFGTQADDNPAKEEHHVNEIMSNNGEHRDEHSQQQSDQQATEGNDACSTPSRLSDIVRATFRRLRGRSHSPIARKSLALQRQAPIETLASATPGRHGLLCPDFLHALLDLRDGNFNNAEQLKLTMRLSYSTLEDLLWRTVIYANHFSDSAPTEISLPWNFHTLSLEQQRFEIIVRQSKLLSGLRNAPSDQAAVENAVLEFLRRIQQRPQSNMRNFITACRDMSLMLHTHLHQGHKATRRQLSKFFTSAYQRRFVDPPLGIDATGLEELFDGSVSSG